MGKIEITDKTRNTKALRKAIYQKMLKLICSSKSISGFCYTSLMVTERDGSLNTVKFDLYRENSSKSAYKELIKYKPKPSKMLNDWWFPCTEEGKATRIKILKEIIEKM